MEKKTKKNKNDTTTTITHTQAYRHAHNENERNDKIDWTPFSPADDAYRTNLTASADCLFVFTLLIAIPYRILSISRSQHLPPDNTIPQYTLLAIIKCNFQRFPPSVGARDLAASKHFANSREKW